MASLAGFDANSVAEQLDFSALPPGKYVAMAIDSELKTTKAGAGQYLMFTFEIIDGQFKGRKIWDVMNINNPNPQAQDIGMRALGALCRAVSVPTPQDSGELHNRPVLLIVDVERDKTTGKEGNKVKKYEPAVAGASSAPAAASFVAAPAQAPVPAAAPAAKAPWAK